MCVLLRPWGGTGLSAGPAAPCHHGWGCAGAELGLSAGPAAPCHRGWGFVTAAGCSEKLQTKSCMSRFRTVQASASGGVGYSGPEQMRTG